TRLGERRWKDCLQSLGCPIGVVSAVEHATVGVECEAREGVSELSAHKEDVHPLRYQQGRIGVPEIVKAQARLILAIDARVIDSDREPAARHVAVVHRPASL